MKERRWVVLGTDGRYATLRRTTDPSDEEIRLAEEALCAQGLSGRLAVMEGGPHHGVIPSLLKVKPLGDPLVSFEDASSA